MKEKQFPANLGNNIVHLCDTDRFVLSTTSKGNQVKWFKNGIYYKKDTFGYEGLAEVIACIVARNIKDFDFIPYEICKIVEGDRESLGCFCKSFLQEDEMSYSFKRILELKYGSSDEFNRKGMLTAFHAVCDCIYELCNIDVSEYMAKILYFDAVILNEDRHFNNFSLIQRAGSFRAAPCFDNGLSLLSDMRDYPMETDLFDNMARVHSKPFLVSFDRQARKLNEMGFSPLVIDYQSLLEELDSFTDIYYDTRFIVRCRAVIKNRLRELEGLAWQRI